MTLSRDGADFFGYATPRPPRERPAWVREEPPRALTADEQANVIRNVRKALARETARMQREEAKRDSTIPPPGLVASGRLP